jgi:hypothetical protein
VAFVRGAGKVPNQGDSTSGLFSVEMCLGFEAPGIQTYPSDETLRMLRALAPLLEGTDYLDFRVLAAAHNVTIPNEGNQATRATRLEQALFCPETKNGRHTIARNATPGSSLFDDAGRSDRGLIAMAVGEKAYGSSTFKILVEEVIANNTVLHVEGADTGSFAVEKDKLCDVTGLKGDCMRITFMSLCADVSSPSDFANATPSVTAVPITVHMSIAPVLLAMYGLKMRLMAAWPAFLAKDAKPHAWSADATESTKGDSAYPYMLALATILDVDIASYRF